MDGFANHVPQHTRPEVVGPVVLDFLGRHAEVAPEAGAWVGCATGRVVDWQNYVETHFNVMRRMAYYHYARAKTWAELPAVHDRFFHAYDHQPHAAHKARTDGWHSPAAVLGWVQGAWCDSADLDHLFRLRATRVLNAGGYLRYRHWRLYGQRGVAGSGSPCGSGTRR